MFPPTYELLNPTSSTRTVDVYAAVRCGARGFRRPLSALSALSVAEAFDPILDDKAFSAAATAFASLRHPGLAVVEDVWEKDGRPWALVPPLVGSSLAQLLDVPAARARPFCPRVASELVLAVAEAARALCDSTGHPAVGEISADSIWMLPDGRPLLLPSAWVDAERAARPKPQDPALARYRAPEMALGVPLDSRVDVYSLALLLWDLFALGRGRTVADTSEATHVAPARVNQGFVQLVMRSLSACPSERPRDVSGFHTELSRLALSEPDQEPDVESTVELSTVELSSIRRPLLSAALPLAVMPAPIRTAFQAARVPGCSRSSSHAPPLEPSRMVSIGPTAPRRPGSKQLRVVRGDGMAGALLLSGPVRRWVIGRARSADLVVCDPDMSREHFEIVESPNGEYRLYDLGSKNGLFVNGAAADQHALRAGDEVRAGETVLRFEP